MKDDQWLLLQSGYPFKILKEGMEANERGFACIKARTWFAATQEAARLFGDSYKISTITDAGSLMNLCEEKLTAYVTIGVEMDSTITLADVLNIMAEMQSPDSRFRMNVFRIRAPLVGSMIPAEWTHE